LVPRPVHASASRDCPADASRDVETYYFPAGAISLERALTESSAHRTTYTARACCWTPTRPIPSKSAICRAAPCL